MIEQLCTTIQHEKHAQGWREGPWIDLVADPTTVDSACGDDAVLVLEMSRELVEQVAEFVLGIRELYSVLDLGCDARRHAS